MEKRKQKRNPKTYMIISIIISIIIWIIAFVYDAKSINEKTPSVFFAFIHSILAFVPERLDFVSEILISYVSPLISYILMCVAYGENGKKAFLRWAAIPTNWPCLFKIVGVIIMIVCIFGYGLSKNTFWW